MTSVTLVGPGAIGCAVAGALVGRDDVDLTIAGRTRFDQLVVDGTPSLIRAPVEFLVSPDTVPAPADIVILATKTHQTEAAAPWLHALCSSATTVAVLQNGISHAERIGPLVGEASVVPTVVNMPSDRHRPGNVTVGLPAWLRVAEGAPGERISSLFSGTYVDVSCEADFHTWAWLKLISNCAVGALTTLTRTDNGVLRDPEARAIAELVIDEAAAVARADGAVLDRGLAGDIIDVTIERAATHISSQATDRLSGGPSEWEVRQLEVVRRADTHGIEVPILRLLTTLVRLGEPD